MLREPCARLRPFVKAIWLAEASSIQSREHVLPTGEIHLAFRLKGPEVRLFSGGADNRGETLGFAVVGGPRSSFYIKDSSAPSLSIGAVLNPGAALPLFGVLAAELAERHTKLSDLWGTDAEATLDWLRNTGSPEERLALFENLLAERLPLIRAVHPAVAAALAGFAAECSVREMVKATAYSHRHFAAVFRGSIGLLPKVYCRIRRFRMALETINRSRDLSLAELALSCGYSDQAHFQREFHKMAGVTPSTYKKLAPVRSLHVPVARGPGA
ncbi:MAG: helix-turn-helix domain-containing protein [Bryobacteraceae bacterium]